MANPQHPDFPFLKSNENTPKTGSVLWGFCCFCFCFRRITPLLPLTPLHPVLAETVSMSYSSTFWGCQIAEQRGAGWILVPDLCGVGGFVGPKRQIKTNQKKHCSDFEFEGWAPNSKWRSPCRIGLSIVVGFLMLAVVLGREIFEGGKAIAAGHVLLKFFL